MSTINKSAIVLTGATGFLGSHLMAAMLKEGQRVIVLGRSSREATLNERIMKLLEWFAIDEMKPETVEADFLKPFLGLSPIDYNKLCNNTKQIIHCASDTSFSERKRESVFKSNVESLGGILKFAADSKTHFFHYISTAYVAGINVEVCRECLPPPTNEYLNVYEETKAMAEIRISEFCGTNSIPYTIIRPSVVYGDSRTGRSLRFNALYLPIQSVKYLKDIYLNDILNNGGKKSKELGIYIDDEGFLFMPLKIMLPARGSLNIIPVDYFTEATMRIITRPYSGGIFNITNNNPTLLEMISVYNERLMKVRGIEIIYGKLADGVQRNPAEELFDRFLEPYRFYLSDTRIFERANTDKLTDNLQPPEFSYDIFRNCMEYAVKVNWGKSL